LDSFLLILGEVFLDEIIEFVSIGSVARASVASIIIGFVIFIGKDFC
jgi:hypothetical protein